MRRRILSILLLTLLLIAIAAGCNKKPKEYNIEELGRIHAETQKMYDEEAKYLTEEEINGGKGGDIYKKCAKETGEPYNEEIILRGIKKQSCGTFNITSRDGEYRIGCYRQIAADDTFVPLYSVPNTSIFIEDGANIIVKGTMKRALIGIEIISPDTIDIKYEGSTVVDSLSRIHDEKDRINAVIYGEVSKIVSIEDFEKIMSRYNTANLETYGYRSGKVAMVTDTDKDGNVRFICFTFDDNFVGQLAEGDEIAFQGDLYSIIGAYSGGQYVTYAGFIDHVWDCYNFSAKQEAAK